MNVAGETGIPSLRLSGAYVMELRKLSEDVETECVFAGDTYVLYIRRSVTR